MYITKIDSKNPSKTVLKQAISILKDGGLVVFPTETAYGIACDAFNASAVKKVFKIKKRETKKTLPLIAGTKTMVEKSGYINRMTKHLTKAFWPGALTVIIPAIPGFPRGVTNTDNELAVRVSSHTVAAALSRGLGHPIVSTSANLAGEGLHYNVLPIIETLGFDIDMILDAGKLPKKTASTLVKCGEEGCQIVREGSIATDKIVNSLKRFC